MSDDLNLKLVLSAISEYAKNHELGAEDIINIFNEGILHFTFPPFQSPLLAYTEPIKFNIAALRLEKQELQGALSYLPSCEKGKQDDMLDRINEINILINKYEPSTH